MSPHVKSAIQCIDRQISIVRAQIKSALEEDLPPIGTKLQSLEETVSSLYQELGAYQMARKLQLAIIAEENNDTLKAFLKSLDGKFKMVSWRPQTITFMGGVKIAIFMPYYSRQCALTKGLTPHLALFGIIQHLSPALSSLAAMLSAALSSYEETTAVLEKLTAKLNVKTVRCVAKAFAENARIGQETMNVHFKLPVEQGKDGIRRIVVSTDGGRVRIRSKRRGNKNKGKGGRGRYKAEWKEPKLIIIIMVDENGRQSKLFSPIIDATMGGPSSAFALLKFYLSRTSLSKTTVSFISDGAKWIWNRTKKLFKDLNYPISKVIFILDYYHAVQHLNKMIAAKKGLKDSDRKAWVKKVKKWLLAGKVSRAIEAMEKICKGTRCKELKTELAYFKSHIDRCDYKTAREAGLPIGSGAVESAVRRVINLRLKGPGIIWNTDGADEMLLLRSFFKSGRWYQLEQWAFAHESFVI